MEHALRKRDAVTSDRLNDVLSVHTYLGGWYNNATFLFPLLAGVGTIIAWTATGSFELLGLSFFFFSVTGIMLPIVFLTWKRTPTAIIIRESGVAALHQGDVMQVLDWTEVQSVSRKETMGNVRWYITSINGNHIAIDGEIDSRHILIRTACRLAQVELENRSQLPD